MKSTILVTIFFLPLFFLEIASAQLNTAIVLDTSFAHGGKVEVSFNGFGDELTDAYFPTPSLESANLTVCGKVGTMNSGLYKLGIVRLNFDGSFDPYFGTNGKVIASWGVSDYPNSMYITPVEGTIVLAGMSETSSLQANRVPALFRFKGDGTPDASFGGDGHVAVPFDAAANGEFTNIYAKESTYLACGNTSHPFIGGHSGFCAMRFFKNGMLDTSFGIGGKAIVEAKVHSVVGFLLTNDAITFIGIADHITPQAFSEILLARMTSKGTPDSAFGKNGIVNTGILTQAEKIYAAVKPNNQILATIPSPGISLHEYFIVMQFKENGTPDSSYGSDGFTGIVFSPGTAQPKGVNIADGGKAFVSGMVDNRCGTGRLNQNGSIDMSFNQTGTLKIDVDSGANPNYLNKFVETGSNKYYGVGGSILKGLNTFLVARFKEDTVQHESVHSNTISEFSVYPNPANNYFNVEAADAAIKNITFIDALGREVETTASFSDSKTYSVDLSHVTNGTYYCIIKNTKGTVVRKVVVVH